MWNPYDLIMSNDGDILLHLPLRVKKCFLDKPRLLDAIQNILQLQQDINPNPELLSSAAAAAALAQPHIMPT